MLPNTELNKFGTKLQHFPRWSLVALAARSCLREPQIVPGLPSAYLSSPTQNPELFKRLILIRAAESCAAAATPPNREIFEDARRAIHPFPGRRENRFPLAFQSPQMFPDQT